MATGLRYPLLGQYYWFDQKCKSFNSHTTYIFDWTSSSAQWADISGVPQHMQHNLDLHDSCLGTIMQLPTHATGDGGTWPSVHVH